MKDVAKPATVPLMIPITMMIAYNAGVIGIKPIETVTYVDRSPTAAVLSVRDATVRRVFTFPSGILIPSLSLIHI